MKASKQQNGNKHQEQITEARLENCYSDCIHTESTAFLSNFQILLCSYSTEN